MPRTGENVLCLYSLQADGRKSNPLLDLRRPFDIMAPSMLWMSFIVGREMVGQDL